MHKPAGQGLAQTLFRQQERDVVIIEHVDKTSKEPANVLIKVIICYTCALVFKHTVPSCIYSIIG